MRVFRGLNITFSWKRFLGITTLKRKVAKTTHIPTTKMGRHAKVGRWLLRLIFGQPKRRRRR